METQTQSKSWAADVEALLAQTRALQDGGDVKGARALLDAAPPPLKRFGTWLYAHGALSLLLGETSTAIEDFQAAVEREPEVAEFRSNLGAALLEQAKAGDAQALERATAELKLATALTPRLPGAFHNLGTAQLLAGDAKAAQFSFDAALKIDPRHVPSLYNRAAALNALGKLEDCLRALDATLAVDPSFAPAQESRANTLARLGRK
jgi:tetratricopeptide (TPR) repeat protein